MNRLVQPRLAFASCERFAQAPLPTRPIGRGRRCPGLLANVLVSKYADHLPPYRQSRIFKRNGLNLDRSTLADRGRQVHRAAETVGRRRRPVRNLG